MSIPASSALAFFKTRMQMKLIWSKVLECFSSNNGLTVNYINSLHSLPFLPAKLYAYLHFFIG